MSISAVTRSLGVRILVAVYAVGVLVLLLLSASNYPVQWREQVNRERERYLAVIAQALEYYVADHAGEFPAIPSTPSMIANVSQCQASCPALSQDIPCYDLSGLLVPGYMHEMLLDPLSTSERDSGFYIQAEGRGVTIGACHAFFGERLQVHTLY